MAAESCWRNLHLLELDNNNNDISSYEKRFERLHSGLIVAKNGEYGQCGYHDFNDNIVIPHKYDAASNFLHGRAIVGIGNRKWNNRVDQIYYLTNQDGSPGGKWGCINQNGDEVIPIGKYKMVGFGKVCHLPCQTYYELDYEVIGFKGCCSNGLLLALEYESDKHGFLDIEGNIVVPFLYEYARKYTEGVAAVCLEDKWGFIDMAGHEVLPFKFSCASSFVNGSALVGISDGYAFIDLNGNELFRLNHDKYEWIGSFKDGMVRVKRGYNKWGFINDAGNEVVQCKYYEVYPFTRGLAKVVGSVPFVEGLSHYYYCLVDKDGNELEMDDTGKLVPYDYCCYLERKIEEHEKDKIERANIRRMYDW